MDAQTQVILHKLEVDALYGIYYLYEPGLFAISFILYLLIGITVVKCWYLYSEQYYKNKKISRITKTIITILPVISILSTVILDALSFYIECKSVNYAFYTKAIALNIKVPWTTSATYMDIVYFYKLMIVMFITQCIFILSLPITIKAMKLISKKQEVT